MSDRAGTTAGEDSPLQKLEVTEQRVEQVEFSPFLRQLLAATPPIIASISSGMLFGYSATLLPELSKPTSDIRVTPNMASWIASTVPLLMSIGCLLGGPLMERFGRKKAHIILCVPKFLGWITIYLAPNLITLLIGRVLGGLSSGLLATLFPTYLAEISEPKYRGFFLVGPSTALAFGIFATHFSGTFLSWRTTALIASFLPLVTAVVLFFVPETPCWYVSKNRFNDALEAFKWLRGDSEVARNEFEATWEKHKETEINRKLGETTWSKAVKAFGKKEFVRPFLIIFCCFFTMQFSGPYVVAFYSISILEKILGSSINEYLVMNIIDVLRLAMVVIASGLLRVTKRRVLMMTSGVGSTVSTLVLAGFLYGMRSNPDLKAHAWVSIVALISYIFFVSIGIFVLPWCMAGELYPLEYRSLGSSINISINFFLFFIVIKVAPEIFKSFGMDGAFLFYGLICFLGTATLAVVMPETRNRTLVDIEKQFSRK